VNRLAVVWMIVAVARTCEGDFRKVLDPGIVAVVSRGANVHVPQAHARRSDASGRSYRHEPGQTAESSRLDEGLRAVSFWLVATRVAKEGQAKLAGRIREHSNSVVA